ncbi:MAG: glycoside hydrolase family 13 protein [Actinomycetota bacterium]|nr:glycoside hydrolase family 13 protein [Actinomycetota bacterium]
MSVAERESTLLAGPHHDGSDQYVERPDDLGGDALVRLRVPAGGAAGVALRYTRDGEPRVIEAEQDGEWWVARFPVANPSVRYRWLLAGGEAGYAWLNGRGLVGHDVPDSDDFVLSLAAGGPEWHLRSVVYEIFPDRFASTGVATEPPAWAISRAWDELPTGRGPETAHEWFGGDLAGIEAHLDHVERLGADVLYLTPIFPAGSTHRYDATSFDRIDPLLGGDEALASLTQAAHARGLRVLGDLTTNHTGVGHEWFDERRPFYYFDGERYESWLGVPSLPKLDWRSEELRERMVAVARRWLEEGLDGWRIDVANMTGRHRDHDLTLEIARELRRAVGDGLLIAELFHDHRGDLRGDGWHGTMDYAGFLKPVWTWLRGDGYDRFLNLPFTPPPASGRAAVAEMRAFRAGVPWQAILHSWTLLDSHDTARFRTVAGSRERQLVGLGLMFTTPGVPMLFAGDELGLEGAWGEDGRRTMPWGREDDWDGAVLQETRKLAALRRSSEALARGGLRYAHVDDDVIAYLRETDSERLLCLASRAPHAPLRLPLGCRGLDALYGPEAVVAGGFALVPADGPAFHVWRIDG